LNARLISSLPRGKFGPPQSNDVQSEDHVSFRRQGKWGQIFQGGAARASPVGRVLFCESRSTADERLVQNLHISRPKTLLAIIRSFNAAVVPMCTPTMKKFSFPIFVAPFRRAAVNSAVFTNQIFIADFDPASCFFRKANILRGTSDNRAVSDSIASTDGYFPFHHDISADHALVRDGNGATNNAVWTDLNVRANLRPRTDDGSAVNHLKHTCFLEAEIRRTTFRGEPMMT
jgi:hypothetical protein